MIAQSVIHPESDWFWVVAELGVPGVSLMMIAVLLALARFIPFNVDRSTPYRAIALGPLSIFLLHTLVDVPAHRFGAVLLAFLFYRLAVNPLKQERSILFPPWSVRLCGLILLMVASAWMGASLFNLPWHTRIAHERALESTAKLSREIERDTFFASLDEGLSAKPLDWWYYTQRARALLFYDRDIRAAQEAFLIARRLEPVSAEVPYQEGVAWLGFNHKLAQQAWLEALQREPMVAESLHRKMLGIGGSRPRFSRELADLSTKNPDLRFRYLSSRGGSTFDNAIYHEINNDPELAQFTAEQRHLLLEHWARRGSGRMLRIHLKNYPQLTPNAWYYEALTLAAEGDYEAATDKAGRFMRIPAFPEFSRLLIEGDAELRRNYLINPKNIVAGSLLLERQLQQNDLPGARETLALLSRNPELPDYVIYWQGELLRREGEFEACWKTWHPYLEKTFQAD